MFIRHMFLNYKDLLFCMNNVVLSDCVCIIDEKISCLRDTPLRFKQEFLLWPSFPSIIYKTNYNPSSLSGMFR